MWPRIKLYTPLLPAFSLGLFAGRILSEFSPVFPGHHLGRTLIITAGCLILAALLLRRQPLGRTWPLLFLFLYVLFPEVDPRTAVLTLLLTAAIFGFNLNRRLPVTVILPLLTGAFLILYINTLAPDILPADNGEFQLIATSLGVAHPPGFSLYTILAHLMTRLPLAVSPAYKVNLFSAFTGALTLTLVFLTTYRLTRQSGAAALSAVLALGTATTFWAQATTANIRSLTGLWAALMIYALVRFREACQPRAQQPNNRERWLILFALVFGAGVTHHASLVFMGLVWLLFIIVVDPSLLRRPRRWLRPLLAGLLGLLPLLYFPLRAGADVRGASASLTTVSGFFNHVLALGFRGDLFHFIQPTLLGQRLQVMGNVLTFQFSPWLLLGMGIGLLLILWRDRKLALLLAVPFFLHTFITATYRAPQTVEYMLPAYILLAIIQGYGIRGVGELSPRHGSTLRKILGALLLVAAFNQGWQHYPSYALLHRDTSVRDYTQSLMDQAPPDAVILADWHWATPLWYLQEVEKQRPDVDVRFVFPEGESYPDTWARRIAAEWENGRPIITTHFDEQAYADLPTPIPLGNAYLFNRQPRLELPVGFQSTGLTLGHAQILGYRRRSTAVEIGGETVITIAWQPTDLHQSPHAFFMHLIGADGRLYGQDDLQAVPQADGITLTQFRLTPRLGAAPGAYALILGTPENDSRFPIDSLNVTAMGQPPISQNPIYRLVPGERPLLRLRGYDWDNTLPGRPRLYLHWQTEQGYHTEVRDSLDSQPVAMPDYVGPWGIVRHNELLAIHNEQFYVPLGQGIVWTGGGLDQAPVANYQPLTLAPIMRSSRPVTRDLVISVRLIGYEADGYLWAWSDLQDSIPAMGGIPTLKWIAGSTVRSPYILEPDPAAQPGQTAGAILRVYDAFTNRPLPILDERLTNELQLAWVPLGQTYLTP